MSTIANSPTVCLTIGDPTGIGPEIAAKILLQRSIAGGGSPNFIVLGDITNLEQTASSLNIPLPEADEGVRYLDVTHGKPVPPGWVAYSALNEAVRLIYEKQATGLVTGPISKANLREAGISQAGHTEILQDIAKQYYEQPYQADMLFLYRQFRMLLLTRHVPLADVGRVLAENPKTADNALHAVIQFLSRHEDIQAPRIAMLGVNPHAGEIGGTEEQETLMPLFQRVTHETSASVYGPLPADAAFRGFQADYPAYDVYVAPYHDQGLIPMKLVAGFEAVNLTLGLPFFRTSVSHGMATDIVGQGIATPVSLEAAIQTLTRLLQPAEAGLLI
ncbi:MAG: 4-hydroxythreonine-4-phosphate dehydrogenase PdxA [Vampirovibrio sp.]|nr:4-hydroxythreonine-4-phosphate dehydrogenase PdxA [Vampirovibrio sp.]